VVIRVVSQEGDYCTKIIAYLMMKMCYYFTSWTGHLFQIIYSTKVSSTSHNIPPASLLSGLAPLTGGTRDSSGGRFQCYRFLYNWDVLADEVHSQDGLSTGERKLRQL